MRSEAARRAAAAAAIGVLGGLTSGLLGIGGGLVMVPLMTLALGVPLKRAVGTSLLAVVAISLVAVVSESVLAPENLRLAPAGALAAGAVLGAWLGSRAVRRLHPVALARLFALILALATWRMLAPSLVEWTPAAELAAPLRWTLLVLAGIAAGTVAALFGIGGGILAVPVLAILHPDWPFQASRATSLLMIVPTSLVGAALHHGLDHVDVPLARSLIPAGAAGAVAGVLLANRLPERPLELAFAALLLVSAWRLARYRPPGGVSEPPA